VNELKIKIFADGADRGGMIELYRNPLIRGLTTNPTLMRKSGITDFEAFAREILEVITDKPISFEVFSDHFPEMRRQALHIQSWQRNVYVKIPVMNSRGESSIGLIRELSAEGVQLNVTAVLTQRQVADIAQALQPATPSVVSIFAGRIADTGRSPLPVMQEARNLLKDLPAAELLWASVREVLNIFEAEAAGCQIVTVPHEILKRALEMFATDLDELSLATVRMFARDAQAAGYSLDVGQVQAFAANESYTSAHK
jgi:transaldolase